MKTFGICPKCGSFCQLTRHHVLPLRFYCKRDFIWLCRNCHNKIENAIPRWEKMPPNFYFHVAKLFLLRKDATSKVLFKEAEKSCRDSGTVKIWELKQELFVLATTKIRNNKRKRRKKKW